MSQIICPDGSVSQSFVVQSAGYTTMTVVDVPADTVHDTQLIGPNPNRNYLAVINLSLNRATLSFPTLSSSNATTWQRGWPAEPAPAAGGQGGGIIQEGNRTHRGAVNAISAAATTFVILEG
jgi:hypothetical protein